MLRSWLQATSEISRRQRCRELKKVLSEAKSYKEWYQAAQELDQLEGLRIQFLNLSISIHY
jgi:hypothetical protein